jgi:hypothetical protein
VGGWLGVGALAIQHLRCMRHAVASSWEPLDAHPHDDFHHGSRPSHLILVRVTSWPFSTSSHLSFTHTGIPMIERRVSLAEFHAADEVRTMWAVCVLHRCRPWPFTHTQNAHIHTHTHTHTHTPGVHHRDHGRAYARVRDRRAQHRGGRKGLAPHQARAGEGVGAMYV